MLEQIASKYAKALSAGKDANTIQRYISSLQKLVPAFGDKKFIDIIEYPFFPAEKKLEMLAPSLDTESKEVKNLLLLLAEKDRLELIPYIAKILQENLSQKKNEYRGFIISSETIDDMVVDNLQKEFSKKVGSNILLSKKEGSYDGVRITVEELGLEIAFSKERLKEKLVNHILKAI